MSMRLSSRCTKAKICETSSPACNRTRHTLRCAPDSPPLSAVQSPETATVVRCNKRGSSCTVELANWVGETRQQSLGLK